MHVFIHKRDDAPSTRLFVKIKQKNSSASLGTDIRPAILLIPGGPGGNHTLYTDIEEKLFEFADIITVDLRGCGLSDNSETKYCTLTHHIKDIDVLLKELKIDKPIIHGCSYGAFVALGVAINNPNLISGLILTSGAVSGQFIESAKKNLVTRGTQEQINAAETLWNGEFKSPDQFSQYYKTMAPLYICNYDPKAPLPAAKGNIPYNIDLVNVAFTSFLKSFDFSEKLSNITLPTLILSGKNDWITDTNEAKKLHRGIKGSNLVILDKCGHFPWKDQPELYIQAVKNFTLKQCTNDNNNGNYKSFTF